MAKELRVAPRSQVWDGFDGNKLHGGKLELHEVVSGHVMTHSFVDGFVQKSLMKDV